MKKKTPVVIKNFALSQSLRAFTSHRERSFATHATRKHTLNRAFQDICDMGYKINSVHQLKPKHVQGLVDLWKENGISIGEMKNRMSHMRWIAEKINKPNIIPRTNRELGIENRKMDGNDINRAVSRSVEDLSKIKDDNVRMSLQAQELFGLRKKESILLNPKRDYDRENNLLRVETGTKGGRPRVVPVRNDAQRAYLEEAIAFQKMRGQTAFIPKDIDYLKQQTTYESECRASGLIKNHGLRHKYAQERYLELTGWECPRVSQISRKMLSPEQLEIDVLVRLQISRELGHGRIQVTENYLGR